MVFSRFRNLASPVLAGGAVLACLSSYVPAHAGGFSIQEQSTRGAGRAFSGEAADTGPESLWWNPAAIAESPMEAYTSLSGIFVNADVNNRGSTVTYPGATTVPNSGAPHASNPILPGIVGGAGFAMPIGDRFAVGFSLASPYDFVTDYKENSFARYQAVKSRLDMVDGQFTGAVKMTPWLDLGAGVDAVYTSARLTQVMPNLSPLLPEGFSNLTGDAWNFGWNVGAQLHTNDRYRIGVSYRSAVGHSLSGDETVTGLVGPLAGANVSTHGGAKFTTPWVATLGGRYHLTDKLTLNGQVQRVGWSEFKSIDVTFPGVNDVIPQNYHDTTVWGLGLDYAMNRALTLRAGFQRDPTPTPDFGRTLRVPDSNRWLFSTGGEMKLGAHLTAEAAIEYVDFEGGPVNSTAVAYGGTPAQTVANYSADVTANAVVVSAGARWRF